MKSSIWPALTGVTLLLAAACAPSETGESDPVDSGAGALEEATTYTVLVGGTAIGAMEISPTEAGYQVEYEYRNNGRGPTISESVTLNDAGMPTDWSIEGASTFGNPISESFEMADGEARWADSTGSDQALPAGPAFYVPQDSSPYWLAIAARALMADEDGVLPALPGGELRMSEVDRLSVDGARGARELTAYAMSGTSTDPSYFMMDGEALFALVTPRFAIIEEGYEDEDARLRELAVGYGSQRYLDIQSRVAHDYDAPVRIANVRIFDSHTGEVGAPASVLVEGERIAAIEAADARNDGEVVIDGAGGVLVPGLFDMHGHMGETAAFLNIAAGVTSIRDMGNDNEVLTGLINRIQAGDMTGPRVFRSCFIEGRSPFNSNNGILVSSQEEALAAVDTCADAGHFIQIKIYNSMNPEWVPAMIERAHERGLRVAGHVPAFSNADAMMAAGYDEMTHINQVMLGWVLEEGEDTRTLLRLTALRRLPGLDLQSEPVQSTINYMAENNIAIDPTYAIHEALLLSRNGEISPGVVDYIDNMPVDTQRQARSAWADIATPEDDANYRGAFDQITETLRMMHEAGIFIVPGTDLGGSFAHHRELELYQNLGMSPAEILSWGTLGMADYLGAGDDLGSIEVGKYADFFLIPNDPTQDFRAIKTIAMVSSGGRIYFPEEIYPEFGIQPFIPAPAVELPR